MTDLLDKIAALLGPRGLLRGDDVGDRHRLDWSGVTPVSPIAVARPTTDEQVAAILAKCRAHSQPIVVQGGMTGVVGAAVPQAGELALSLERMTRIGPIDPIGLTVTAEAGATVQAVQEACEARDLLFPLDLGSRGSATVGGVVATNAGGNRVLRYGSTRALLLGVDAILGDGSRITALRPMLKDNCGYDVKQLLVGSEGTLGVVTRAMFRLWQRPPDRQVAFVRAGCFDAVVALFARMERACGALTAFEAMWPGFYRFVVANGGIMRPPLAVEGQGVLVLVEQLGGHAETFEAALMSAIEAGECEDAVLARSESDARDLWAVRDAVGPASAALKPFLSYDIGFGREAIAAAVAAIDTQLGVLALPAPPLVFGHIGDGNIHILAGLGDGGDALGSAVDATVYGVTREFGGTISAEHGIGTVKRVYLSYSRGPGELAAMRTLKAAFDPDHVLGRGRIWAA